MSGATVTEFGKVITFRQLDYWTTHGYLEAEEPNPGSGHRRTWSGTELRIAAEIVRLTSAGLTTASAARVARETVSHDSSYVDLAPGITIEIEGTAA
jgi:hypothetical protein